MALTGCPLTLGASDLPSRSTRLGLPGVGQRDTNIAQSRSVSGSLTLRYEFSAHENTQKSVSWRLYRYAPR